MKKEDEDLKERNPKRARLRESEEADEVVEGDEVFEGNEVVKVEERAVPIYSEKVIKIEESRKLK